MYRRVLVEKVKSAGGIWRAHKNKKDREKAALVNMKSIVTYLERHAPIERRGELYAWLSRLKKSGVASRFQLAKKAVAKTIVAKRKATQDFSITSMYKVLQRGMHKK